MAVPEFQVWSLCSPSGATSAPCGDSDFTARGTRPPIRGLMLTARSQVREALRPGVQEPTAQRPASVQRHTRSDGNVPGKMPPHQLTPASPAVAAAAHTLSRCLPLTLEAADTPVVSTSHWGPQAWGQGQALSAVRCRITCFTGGSPIPTLFPNSQDPEYTLLVR